MGTESTYAGSIVHKTVDISDDLKVELFTNRLGQSGARGYDSSVGYDATFWRSNLYKHFDLAEHAFNLAIADRLEIPEIAALHA